MPTTITTATEKISQAYTLMNELAKAAGDPLMPMQQLAILAALAVRGEVSQADLEGITNVAGKTSNSRNVLKLGKGNAALGPGLGLIEQVEDLMDLRAKRIRLTPQGRKVVEMAMRATYPQDTKD